MNKIWTVTEQNEEDAWQLSEQLGLTKVVAEILTKRGLSSSDQAADFLRPTLLNVASPFCFGDMNKTVERLAEARQRQEKVLVYGDYDVDGVTSTALLYKVLIDLGFRAVAYIPHRQEEGYGLHGESIEKAAQAEVKIIITVDCGITAQAEVELARHLGIEVIITDHHEPPAVLPEAYAILNPKLHNSGYPFRDLAGVGVAFKLVQALLQKLGNSEVGMHSELEILDLVALGTIADVVPLVGENRILVQYGLSQMARTVHLGLGALVEECGLNGKSLTAGQVAFMLAPRINAAGRMDSARTGLELLLTQDQERAVALARQLSRENTLRQETERQILAETIAQLESAPVPRVIVLSSPNWHHGVIGIVASRLVERYYRPVFLIAEDGEESKGSARGIAGYHVLEQLNSQAGLLTKYGGHRQAAGFSLPTQNITQLREGLNKRAQAFDGALFNEVLRLDSLVNLQSVGPELQQELELLAPFGFGNPGPVLAAEQVAISSVLTVGKDAAHLKLKLGAKAEWEGMAFRQGERLSELSACEKVDIAFSLEKNTFQGRDQLVLIFKDVQAEADWYHHKRAVQAELAAAQEENRIKWLDWRTWERQRWMKQALAEACLLPPAPELELADRIAIWDGTRFDARLLTLAEFRDSLGGSLAGPLGISELRPDSRGNWGLGIMIGIPRSWREFKKGVKQLKDLGVAKIAFAEVNVSEDSLQQRSGYLAREVLVSIYRELQEVAQKSNPFAWELTTNTYRQALKIFEELGLVRCLGGTEVVALELLPVGQKMDLDSSLYYTVSKKCWQETQELRQFMLEFPIEKFDDKVNYEERRQII